MLRIETIEPPTFSVLKQIMEIAELKNFSLVGDAALSHLYEHRISDNLVLFSNLPFDNADIVNVLEKYATQNLLITIPQALSYFADSDDSEEPISLKKQTWDGVKQFINEKVREYLK